MTQRRAHVVEQMKTSAMTTQMTTQNKDQVVKRIVINATDLGPDTRAATRGEEEETKSASVAIVNPPDGSTSEQRFSMASSDLKSWLTDVLYKMAPGDLSSIDADAQVMEDDLRNAAKTLPFLGMRSVYYSHDFILMVSILVDFNIKPSPYYYHNIPWYPGIQGSRKKEAGILGISP